MNFIKALLSLGKKPNSAAAVPIHRRDSQSDRGRERRIDQGRGSRDARADGAIFPFGQ